MEDLTQYQRNLIRDMREGHLTIWHDDGRDFPDRQILGGAKTWKPLVDKGYLELLPGGARWTLTKKGEG